VKKIPQRVLVIIMILEAVGIVVALGFILFWYFGNQDGTNPEVQEEVLGSVIASQTVVPETGDPTAQPTTPVPSPTLTLFPSPTITATAQIAIQAYFHVVRGGETLSVIAQIYGLSLGEILEVNPQISDPNDIYPGDQVRIPGVELSPDGSSPLIYGAESPYTALPSMITADIALLAGTYPLQGDAADGRLILHYQPGAYVDLNFGEVQGILTEAFQFVEAEVSRAFDGSLDLYLAGSLFQDQENLRGFTQSGLYRSYLLVDGTGSLGEQTYLFAHEFTHIFAFHQWGRYHSPMVHEGLATYLPQQFLKERTDYLPLDQICAAIKGAGKLIPMTTLAGQSGYGPPYFEGHIRSFLYYNQSGCFVKYLIETYGLSLFADVFHSGDYAGVYGKSLVDLDLEFQAQIDEGIATVDPQHFVSTVGAVAAAYDDYFIRTSRGQHANFQAYLTLDNARLAVNAGDLAQADQFLDLYYKRVEG
jgi:LysM repeat protein